MNNTKLLSILASISTLLILLFVFLLLNKTPGELESEHIYPEIHKIKSDNSEITITWPEPRNLSTTIKNRITHVIAYQNLTGEPLQATEHFYAKCECGVVGGNYQIHYDGNNILSLSVTVDRLGAYPSSSTTHHSFNLQTGFELKAEEIFKSAKLDELTKKINEQLQSYIEVAKPEAEKQDWQLNPDDFKHEFSKKHINNFILTTEGVTFFYNFDFPHAVKAAEPKSDIAFSYEELADFFSEEGLLHAFAAQSESKEPEETNEASDEPASE